MPKVLKYIGYFFLFVFLFFIFLYWTFPYGVLKDRLISATQQQLGGNYDIKIGDFSPSFFTGATLKDVKIIKHENNVASSVLEATKVKIRTTFSSLLFGNTSVKFTIKNQKGSVSGSFKGNEDGFLFNGDFSDFNVGNLGFISGTAESGTRLVSDIDGEVKLNINKRQIIQSTGNASFTISNLSLKPGELKLGEGMNFTIPELILAKGSGSTIKLELLKGAIKVKEFKLNDSDLKMELSGDIFMSSILKNYRMNLKGTFSVTPKLEQAIPFLFMVEKQRQPDGTYPITITGRISQPSIKIGDFTLPI